MEKLTKDFCSLRGDKFDPTALYCEIKAGLPADLSAFNRSWMDCAKFCTQCEFADPNFLRRTLDDSVGKTVERAIASIPTRLFSKIYFESWLSRISHSSDWKVLRYLEKQDFDALFENLVPLAYIAVFVELRKAQYHWDPIALHNSILSYIYDLLDENGVFAVSAYDDGKSIVAAAKVLVWWIHHPRVKEVFQQAREAYLNYHSEMNSIKVCRSMLAELAKCAASTYVEWMPDLRDE